MGPHNETRREDQSSDESTQDRTTTLYWNRPHAETSKQTTLS